MRLLKLSKVLALIFLARVLTSAVGAQDHTVLFNVGSAGVTKAITNWGIDVTWPNFHNTRLSVLYMGNEIDMVRVGFQCNEPISNGLTASLKADYDDMAGLANMASTTKWTMSHATGAGVDSWYKTNSNVNVIPSRWVQAMTAAKQYYNTNYNRTIITTEPFNEPDYGWNQGTVGDLYDIMGSLQTNTNFTGVSLAGGSTLNVDWANWWYDQIKTRATEGTTHTLAGTFDSYVSFIQNVIASGDVPSNPEVHNLVEVIAGAEYGLHDASWWGEVCLTRASFVQACQGKRLGFAEDRSKWTAAAVYRGTSGTVQGFVGGSERMGATTTYRFFSRDRDVFYDGDGPRRDYTVSIPIHQEKMVNIASGSDVPPPITGRFIIVNRKSGLAMEVQNGSNSDGANVRQNTYIGAAYQQWDIAVCPANTYVDQAYYWIKPAHNSSKNLDVAGGSYSPPANVQQWAEGGGWNQQWFFEYAGNGCFYIRDRWGAMYLEVASGSSSANANVQQYSFYSPDPTHQQWRLIPATVSAYDFVAPAAPTGFHASANAVSVQLKWNPNTEPDLAGYTVLRSTNVFGPYGIIARGLTNNAFTDKSANQPRPYFYKLIAVDRSLNSSASSELVAAIPPCGPALIARYAFDGNLSDSSLNANHPIVTNGSPTFLASQYGWAMDLNGTSQYIMLPANMLAGVTNFTIALWVKWGGGGEWQHIIDCGNDRKEYMLLTPSSNLGRLRWAITTNSWENNAEQVVEISQPLPVGEWIHVAVTRDGTMAKLYTNGVLAASNNAVTISPADFNPALNYLGESQFEENPLFNGQLDDLFIYNYALSGSEVLALANLPPYPPVELAGTVIGSPGSWGGLGNTITKAFDNNLGSYYDAANASGDWAGLDLGSPQVIKQVTYCPRSGFAWRMPGGVFQGANVADFSSGVVTLFTVTATPPEGALTSQLIIDPGSYRYVRYLGPDGAYCNVAELEFYTAGTASPPAAPTNLTAAPGNSQIRLNWTASPGATSYYVKRSMTSGGSYSTIASNVTTTSYTNTGLVNGTRYYYVVSTLSLGGEGTNSTQVSAVPVTTAPVNLSISNSGDSVILSWPTDHTGWRLQSQTNTPGTGLGTNWSDVAGSTDTNVVPFPVDANHGSVFYRLTYP